MGPTISDSRWTAVNEATVEGFLRPQFALGDDNSAVSIKPADLIDAANVDANTRIAKVIYAMLSGSSGMFTVNPPLASTLTFSKAYLYVRARDATGPKPDSEHEYSLDLTGPLGSYLSGGTDEQGLYEGIRTNVLGSNLSGVVDPTNGTEYVGSTNGIAYRAAGSTEPATGDIEVGLGKALAGALGLDAGANLDQIGKAFVRLKYSMLEYTPGSAVVMTEFELPKLGAQNALRFAAGDGYRGSAGAQLQGRKIDGPVDPVGFFSASGLSSVWTVAIQDENGDVGGVLDGLSSHRAYSKFIAISAGSLLSGLPADIVVGTTQQHEFTV